MKIPQNHQIIITADTASTSCGAAAMPNDQKERINVPKEFFMYTGTGAVEGNMYI